GGICACVSSAQHGANAHFAWTQVVSIWGHIARGWRDGGGDTGGDHPHHRGEFPLAPPTSHANRSYRGDQCLVEGHAGSGGGGARGTSNWGNLITSLCEIRCKNLCGLICKVTIGIHGIQLILSHKGGYVTDTLYHSHGHHAR